MRYTRITLLCIVLCYATSSYAAPFLYVANRGDHTVSVVDTETNTVIATVDVGRFPTLIEVDPFGAFIYVHNGEGSISVIDTSTNSVVATVKKLQESDLQGDQSGVFDMAIHPTGTILYTARQVALSVIDPIAHAFVEEIDVQGDPLFVTVHPAGAFLYATSIQNAEVVVVDTATHAVVDRVKVDPFPWDMAFHPEGRLLYVGSVETTSITVIDTAMNAVVANIPVVPEDQQGTIEDIQFHPEGTVVYVADALETIFVIDTTSHETVATIPLRSFGLTVHPEGDVLYAMNNLEENSIAVIDTATHTVVDSIVVGNDPRAVAIAQPVPRQISGCVDLGGVPLVQHKVTLKQTDEAKQKTTTDAKGCYAFESIAAGKKFKVTIKGLAIP